MAKDYYTILGIGKNASKDDIKKAFRVLAHQYHPDKEGGDAEKFKEINEAYQILSDDEKRAQYDRFGRTFDQAGAGGFGGFQGFHGANPGWGSGVDFEDLSEMFGSMFGFGGGGGRRERRGGDIHMDLRIPFRDAAFGAEREVNLYKPVGCSDCDGSGVAAGSKMKACADCGGEGRVRRTQRTILGNIATVAACHACQGVGNIPERKCPRCSGSGVVREDRAMTVRIPAGIADGETVRVRGAGEAGPQGAAPGDLYLRVHVEHDPHLKREGFDTHAELELAFSEAALGVTRTVPTLDGDIEVKVPGGIQPGERIRLRGRGITRLGRTDRGDHYLHVRVKVPKSLSRKAKRLLKELGEEGS